MDPGVRKIVLVPRFTALVGARTFTTMPIPVRQFASAGITAWRGNPLGGTPDLDFVVQQSQDLQTWWDLDTLSPAADAEAQVRVDFTMDWARVAMVLTGS